MLYILKIKLYLLLLGFLLVFAATNSYAQNNAGQFGLEITKAKVGLNVGPYRGRTPLTNGPFNQGVAGFAQIYFPFQFSADYRSNFSDSATVVNEYNKRKFLLRPSALLHFVDDGSLAFGMAIQFSFLIAKDHYLEYQIAGVYLEASRKDLPDLKDGFNIVR